MNPFDPGTYGARYFDRIRNLPTSQLRRLDHETDLETPDTADGEAARMIRSQAIFRALAEHRERAK